MNSGRDVSLRLKSSVIRLELDGIVRFEGVGNRRNDVRHYASLTHFRRQIPMRCPGAQYDFLLRQSFIDSDFVACRKPKLFFTREPPQLMDAHTVRSMRSEELRPFIYLYDEPVPEERMFFPVLPHRRTRIVKGLQRSLGERRQRLCCIINRYSENRRLNLVEERLRFVRAMGPDIDVYGRPPWSGENKWERFPSYRGIAESKLDTLRRYTFALTFENTDHAGYVSEKILDALLAGAIPLYWGGGEYLGESIPRACYIDCRSEKPGQLVMRLKDISIEEVMGFRRAGIEFLRSQAADRFTWEYFADAVIRRFADQHAREKQR